MYLEFDIVAGAFVGISAIYPGGNPSNAYYNLNTGSVVRNGNQLTINYDYETCDPVGSDVVTISGSDFSDSITLHFDATTSMTFYNAAKWTPADPIFTNSSTVFSEDTNCTYF